MRKRNPVVLASVLVGFLALARAAEPQAARDSTKRHAVAKPAGRKYPAASKGSVVDRYFGTDVADPYRWMEDVDSPETRAWIAAENALTFRYLGELPGRDAMRKRITELWDYSKVSVPRREGGRLYYRRNTGLQRQAVLFTRADVDAPPAELIDPNQLSPDGSISLSNAVPSPDGQLVAYGLSQGGADWQELHVREVSTGRDRPDTVRWVRFSGLSWTKDGKGFFYSRFAEPPAGKMLSAALVGHTLYYHVVGTPQASDRLIYQRKDLPTWFVGGDVSEDGRYLAITITPGATPRNRLYVVDMGDPLHPSVSAPVVPIVERDDAEYEPIGTEGTTMYVRTDLNAPKRRVVAVDLRNPAVDQWRTVVAEGANAMESVTPMGGRLVLQYLEDVQSRLRVVDPRTGAASAIALPEVGTVVGLSARADTPELFYALTSPLRPTTVFRYDPATGVSTPFDPPRMPFDPSPYETRAEFYPSKDGTRVPIFITARKGLKRDGTNPTMLYAYGGFSASITPGFRPDLPLWLEMGGVYATANLRGGGEYGEAWHRAGMRARKQTVFDDFIAAAEYLVRERYTSPAKLAIMGGSNGGLLVGAVMEQRPDLYRVALPAVGVMDMLRYDRFTGGAAWASEYGSSSDSTAFPYLRAYSPLHNIKPGTCYPATLVTTADHDDRVVPSHSFKFTAALQAAQGCDRPVLIRVETQGSHGYRPTDKQIAERADQWAFTAAQMGVPYRTAIP